MVGKISSLVIHVANVWQTCEWYGKVFGIEAILSTDASAARLDVPDQHLIFAAHTTQEVLFGPHHLNSFLSDPPGFHLSITTADVATVFTRALSQGAVAVFDPAPGVHGHVTASLRDLNGILVYLTQRL